MVLRITLLYLIVLFMSPMAADAQTTPDARHLNLQGKELLENGQYRKAKEVFRQSIELSAHRDPSLEQARGLSGYAEAITTSNFVQADSLYCKALAIFVEVAGKTPEYAQTLQNLADVRLQLQKYDGVEQMLSEVVDIKEKSFGPKSAEYADALRMQVSYYIDRSDFVKAEEIMNQSLKIISDIAPNSYMHGKITLTAVLFYFAKQEYTLAESSCKQSIEILTKTAAPSDRELINARATLAVLYGQTGRFKEAEAAITELMPIIEREYGREDSSYSILLSTLGGIYAMGGRMEESLPIFEEAIELNKRIFSEKHHSYVNAISMLAIIYMNTDRLEQSEALMTQTLEIRKQIYGMESRSYINALNNLAMLYLQMGNDARASDLLVQVIELSKLVLGESSFSYILALTNMATCCNSLKLYDQVIMYTDSVEVLMTKYDLIDKPEFAFIRGRNLVDINQSGKAGPKFEQQMKEHIERLKAAGGESDMTYHNMVNAMCVYYYAAGDYQSALDYSEEARRIVGQYRGVKTDGYASVMCNRGASLYKLHRWTEAEESFAESLTVVKDLAMRNFAFMSERERDNYWVSIKRMLYKIEDFVGYAAQNHYDSPALHCLVYDYTLLTKSMLLNYSTDVQQSILQSDDRELIGIWERLKALKADPENNEAEIESLNKQLVLRSMVYRDHQRAFVATWQDVRDRLMPGEAAIEATMFNMGDEDNPLLGYLGLVLRRESTSPELVFLCKERELAAALEGSYHDGSELYPLMFAPLEKHLDGVKRLYIAGNGLASRLSFSGMVCEGEYLVDKYSICNLLSTKDIVRAEQLEQPFTDSCSIALFGGADFGLSPTEILASESNIHKSGMRGLVGVLSDQIDLSRGQGFDYLPGSKKEVTQIGSRLAASGWAAAVYTDSEAIESRFKTLSSTPVDVIHISTHGYYFPLKDAQDKQSADNKFKLSDDPLIRSGLLFSGANSVWKQGSKNDSIDDGVLTGSEISLMDLSRTRLVVLSACNTAIGDIDYWEGVYGLQRAFRMAGAGSVLVSLWEIPDHETTIFMEAFYEHLAVGVSIRDAFEATIRKMKSDYPDNPKVWAGFVLME